MKKDVIVWGAGGFVGGELLRLICCHPEFRLKAAISSTHEDRKVASVYPSLAPFTDLSFCSGKNLQIESLLQGDSIIFSAQPHKQTMKVLPPVIDKTAAQEVKIVDLSGDFRLSDPALYEEFYKTEHLAKSYLERFVYGLAEINKSRIKTARYVANPGCFATAAQLAVLPMASLGRRIQAVAIDGKTGSSGAGITPRETTHHPNRMNNYRAYKPLSHQHTPEIVSSWIAEGGAEDTPLSFVPQMAPLVRGIYVTAHFFLDTPLTEEQITDRYQSFYSDAPFIRLLESSPTVAEVWGTNRADISLTVRGKTVVASAAIDNLIKGAAGSAIQNANLMSGFEETSGLLLPAPSPV